MQSTDLPLITPDSRLVFHPLEFQRVDGKPTLIASPATRAVAEGSEQTVAVILGLQAGWSPRALAARFPNQIDSGDIESLAKGLAERRFVKAIDGVQLPVPHEGPIARLIGSWSPSCFLFLTHPLFLAGLAAVVLAAFGVAAFNPSVLPDRSALALTSRPGINMAAVLGGFLAMSFIHELAHMTVARRYGVRSGISLSHRFYLVVLQTDVTNAWLLPRRQRIAIFMAGIVLNLVVAGAALLALASDQLVGAGRQFTEFLFLVNLLPLGYQLLLFARTDLYHVLAALTGERNLVADSMAYVAARTRARMRSVLGRPADPVSTRMAGKRHRVLLAWGAVQMLGSAYGIFMVTFLLLPFLMVTLFTAVSLIASAWGSGNPIDLAEGLLVLGVAGLQGFFVGRMLGRGLIAVAKLPVRLVRRRAARNAVEVAA